MKKMKKKDITREKILTAARSVFSKHSYEAGSVRMIAKEGGFEFSLIRYYFPNKAELFKTVFKDACDEMLQAHKKAMKGMEKMRPEEGFSLYHDRFLKHYFNHPEGLRILVNNIYRPVDSEVEIPGYEQLPQIDHILLNTIEAEHRTTLREETIGSGQGTPNESVEFMNNPVLEGELPCLHSGFFLTAFVPYLPRKDL